MYCSLSLLSFFMKLNVLWSFKKIYATCKCVWIFFFIWLKELERRTTCRPWYHIPSKVKLLLLLCVFLKGRRYTEGSPLPHTLSFLCYCCFLSSPSVPRSFIQGNQSSHFGWHFPFSGRNDKELKNSKSWGLRSRVFVR